MDEYGTSGIYYFCGVYLYRHLQHIIQNKKQKEIRALNVSMRSVFSSTY